MIDEACPDPASLLQALAEDPASPLAEHIHSCEACQQQPALREALQTWQALDMLPEMQLSGAFEARLQARLTRESQREWRWAQLDRWFDWLHLPALVALVACLFWVSPPQNDVQVRHWQRPAQHQDLKKDFPIQTDQALTWLKNIYTQRSDNG